MYAIAILRYRKPIEAVEVVTPPHRDYLRQLEKQGTLIAAGPMDPRFGGVLLFWISDELDFDATTNAIRDQDPFVKEGIAQYEIVKWNVGIGKDNLDRAKK